MTFSQRFWSKVEKTEDCWNWTAYRAWNGYGHFNLGGHRGPIVKAHRVAYELIIGPVPDGLDLDHLCRNRACVNPAHLEPVTRSENLRRGETGKSPTSRRERDPVTGRWAR